MKRWISLGLLPEFADVDEALWEHIMTCTCWARMQGWNDLDTRRKVTIYHDWHFWSLLKTPLLPCFWSISWLIRVNLGNVLDEGLRIGGRGHQMNSKVKD
jgi:hypothetical protein